MDDEGLDLIRREPDTASAILALQLAAESLGEARARFSRRDYTAALELSRNAMRLASSALLFRDGCVCPTLESASSYLAWRYPGSFPLDEWERLESIPIEDSPGLYNMILSALGKLKKAGEQEATDALSAASIFIESARAEMMG